MNAKSGRKPSRGLRAAVGFALPLVCAAVPAMAAVTGAWSATATRSFEFAETPNLQPVDARMPLHIVLALQLRNRDELQSRLQHIHTRGDAQYQHFLSGAEFTARYAPSAVQAQAVADFLRAAGFANVAIAPNRLLVSGDAGAGLVQRAFNTRLAGFERDGHALYANLRDAQVPAALGGVVAAVLGLQNAEMARTHIVPAALGGSSGPTTVGHVPTEFPALYNAHRMPTAAGLSVGISTWGDMTQAIADIAQFESEQHLAPTPIEVRTVGAAGTDTNGTPEWDLDAQDIIGMSGGVSRVLLYAAASANNGDLLESLNQAVSDNRVQAINASWGECERGSDSSGFVAAADIVFQQAAAQGQTFFFSSGDGGSRTGCYTHRGLFVEPNYPATSPYVTAVGGTTVYTNADGSYASEKAWSGSGGGYSKVEAAPSWQVGTINVCGGRQGRCGRSIPDLAMDADPNSGAIIVVNGKSAQYGGTSLAAPLATAVWLRIAAVSANPGFAAPQLYQVQSQLQDRTFFRDVTSGSNGAYKAGEGWDAVTGFGSIDLDVLYGMLLGG